MRYSRPQARFSGFAKPPTSNGRDMSNRMVACENLYSPTLKLVGLASPNDTLSELVTSWSKSFDPYTADRSQLQSEASVPRSPAASDRSTLSASSTGMYPSGNIEGTFANESG